MHSIFRGEKSNHVKPASHNYYALVTANMGYDKGVRIWKIKAVKTCSNHRQFGVVTNNNCVTKDKTPDRYMHNTDAGLSYFYGNHFKALVMKKGSSSTKELVKGLTKIEDGQVITILLDCVRWKMTWWKEEVRLGTVDIEKNKKYFPAMCCCGCNSEYVGL